MTFENKTRLPTDHATVWERNGWCFTIRVNGAAVAIVGLDIKWKDRAEVWLMRHKDGLHKFAILLAVSRRFKELLARAQAAFRRLEAPVSADFHEANVLARYYGFKPEGRMKRFFSDGKDATMYSLVRD